MTERNRLRPTIAIVTSATAALAAAGIAADVDVAFAAPDWDCFDSEGDVCNYKDRSYGTGVWAAAGNENHYDPYTFGPANYDALNNATSSVRNQGAACSVKLYQYGNYNTNDPSGSIHEQGLGTQSPDLSVYGKEDILSSHHWGGSGCPYQFP